MGLEHGDSPSSGDGDKSGDTPSRHSSDRLGEEGLIHGPIPPASDISGSQGFVVINQLEGGNRPLLGELQALAHEGDQKFVPNFTDRRPTEVEIPADPPSPSDTSVDLETSRRESLEIEKQTSRKEFTVALSRTEVKEQSLDHEYVYGEPKIFSLPQQAVHFAETYMIVSAYDEPDREPEIEEAVTVMINNDVSERLADYYRKADVDASTGELTTSEGVQSYLRERIPSLLEVKEEGDRYSENIKQHERLRDGIQHVIDAHPDEQLSKLDVVSSEEYYRDAVRSGYKGGMEEYVTEQISSLQAQRNTLIDSMTHARFEETLQRALDNGDTRSWEEILEEFWNRTSEVQSDGKVHSTSITLDEIEEAADSALNTRYALAGARAIRLWGNDAADALPPDLRLFLLNSVPELQEHSSLSPQEELNAAREADILGGKGGEIEVYFDHLATDAFAVRRGVNLEMRDISRQGLTRIAALDEFDINGIQTLDDLNRLFATGTPSNDKSTEVTDAYPFGRYVHTLLQASRLTREHAIGATDEHGDHRLTDLEYVMRRNHEGDMVTITSHDGALQIMVSRAETNIDKGVRVISQKNILSIINLPLEPIGQTGHDTTARDDRTITRFQPLLFDSPKELQGYAAVVHRFVKEYGEILM